MSRAQDFAAAVAAQPTDAPTHALLEAIARAWLLADEGIPSETEANRWSPVCSAAEAVVGL